MKKLGFIGCGNMGEAMLAGVLKNGWAKGEEILVHTKRPERGLELHDTYHVGVRSSNREVAEEAAMLVLAVKPNMYKQVLEEIADVLTSEHTVIGIAPAFTVAALTRAVGNSAVKIARAMPNTPALVGKGMTGLCFSDQMAEDDRKAVRGFFEAFGRVMEVEEQLMPAVGSVSGSSPAFVYMMIEAMAQGAIEQGMTAGQAYTFAAAAVEGAAHLVLQSGEHPAKLRDAVCSAGGTTIAGVNELERNGFKGNTINAMHASEARFKALEEAASATE